MDDRMRFTVIPIDGGPEAINDICTPSIRYDGLTWAESVELARISFLQGYTVVIWKENKEGGGGECVETQGST